MASALEALQALENGAVASVAKVKQSKQEVQTKTDEANAAVKGLAGADETRRKILEAKLADIDKWDEGLLSDMNSMVLNLLGATKAANIKLKSLDKPSEAEVAEQALCEKALSEAKAGWKYNPLKDSNIAKAQASLDAVKLRILDNVHTRIIEASLEERFQSIDVAFQDAITSLSDDFKAILKRLKVSTETKTEAEGSLVEASRDMQKFEKQIKDFFGKIELARAFRDEKFKGDPEYDIRHAKMTTLENDKKVAEDNLVTATSSYQEHEKNIGVFAAQMSAQNKILAVFKTMSNMLDINRKYLIVQTANRLADIKGRHIAEAGAALLDLGSVIQKDSVDEAGATVQAMGNLLLKSLENHPKDMEHIRQVEKLTKEILAGFDERATALREKLKKDCGFDPLAVD